MPRSRHIGSMSTHDENIYHTLFNIPNTARITLVWFQAALYEADPHVTVNKMHVYAIFYSTVSMRYFLSWVNDVPDLTMPSQCYSERPI